MTRRFFALLFFLGLTACAPRHEEIPLLTYDTPTLTLLSAQAHAADLNGKSPADQPQKGLYLMADTHSMEPVMWGGDYIVVAPPEKRPYSGLRVGEVVTYRADWLPAGALPVTHRLAMKDKYGWILTGDNNSSYESRWRMTEEDYLGTVVAIYRFKP